MDRIESKRTNAVLPATKAKDVFRSPGQATGGIAPRAGSAPSVGVAISSLASSAGDAEIDHERVAEIRKAIEEGRYPVVPARIADAMIAAGFLLRTGR